MTSPTTEADVAQRVLEQVGPGVEAEVLVERRSLSLTRFANSYIHQNVADVTTLVRLRVHAEGRTAATSTTVVDGVEDLVRRTLASIRQAPADPTWPGLSAPASESFGGNVDAATATAEPADRAARVRDFVDQAADLDTAGYCSTTWSQMAYANSAGHHLRGGATRAALDGIARTPTSDGVVRLSVVRLGDLDGAVLGARAAAKARAGADPVELAPGRYEVVLEPTAVADLLQMLALYGFNAKPALDRQSFVEPGAAQFDPMVTLVDDATAPDSTAWPFDVEGTPRRRLTLVDAGVSTALTHDRRTAARAGAVSTGHAVAGGAAFGTMVSSLRLLPAPGPAAVEVDGPAADSSVLALAAGVERGLLVTDNWYTRVLDPRSLVVTGLTRNGVWLIEDGVITTPVKNFRFTQSYPQALGPSAVLGVGSQAVGLPGAWSEAGFVAPALRLASWNFTGGASG